MHPSQDFQRIYTDIVNSIAGAIAAIAELDVEHKDGKQEINNMMSKLDAMRARFDGELAQLKEHAEWEKFTVAFFGETNAGKSTIIESLRILFDEESRQDLLRKNAYDIKRYETTLTAHIDNVREGLTNASREHLQSISHEIDAVKADADRLAAILHDEVAARLKLQQDEASARSRQEEKESSARLQILQNESSARIQRKIILRTVYGAIAGCALAVPLTLFVRSLA